VHYPLRRRGLSWLGLARAHEGATCVTLAEDVAGYLQRQLSQTEESWMSCEHQLGREGFDHMDREVTVELLEKDGR
jgi:hypothetical protein